jgi:hypothetical protein
MLSAFAMLLVFSFDELLTLDVIGSAVFEFLAFSIIPVLDWTIVTGDTGIDFSFFAADWALPLFAL